MYNSPEEQFRSKHWQRVQPMKDSCSRSEQSIFCLPDLYYYQSFSICSFSTRGAHDGSSLPPQYSSGSDPSPNVPTENSPPLSLALGCTPASGRVQTWLFSNIIRKEIALLFFFANGLQPCVSCIPSRTHYAQQEKERKKEKQNVSNGRAHWSVKSKKKPTPPQNKQNKKTNKKIK